MARYTMDVRAPGYALILDNLTAWEVSRSIESQLDGPAGVTITITECE